jgi:hypothetical protein
MTMTISMNYSAPRRAYAAATYKATRVAAVLIILLLGALCEVAVRTHFDPDHLLDAAETFVAP